MTKGKTAKVSLNEETIKYIIARVLSNANDTLKDDDKSDFTNGKRLAYYEVLDTIKNELEVREQDLKEFGLDVNLEDLFL